MGFFRRGSLKRRSPLRTSRSEKAGLFFPVARVHRYLRAWGYSHRISGEASVYLAAVLEYLAAEVLDVSGAAARQNKKRRITERSIKLAVSSDEELSELLSRVVIAGGGVMPNIHPALKEPPRKKKKGKTERRD